MGAVRDLFRATDRARAIQHARSARRRSRFGAVFSHAAAGIMIIAIGGKVVEVNQAFCTMFGRGPEAFVGSDVYVFARLDDEPGSVEEVRSLLDGERDQVSLERTYLHRDGSPCACRPPSRSFADPRASPAT